MNGPDPHTLVPFRRVALPLGIALVAEPVAWLLLLGVADGAWYGRPELLLAVHALTIGTLVHAIVGVGWQIVPVVTARAWNPRLAPVLNGMVSAGGLAMVTGLRYPGFVGHLGATVLVCALVIRSVLLVRALVAASGRRALRAWLLGAEGCLLGGLVVGAALWAGRAGVPFLPDPIAGVRLHASLLLGGWVGGWIVGAGALLLPMFAVGREPRPTLLAVAAAGWFGGIVLQSPALWGAGAVLSALLLGSALLGGLKRGAPLWQALAGAGGLLVSAGLLLAGEGERTVVALLALFVLPVLHGVGQRIGPFLAWTAILGDAARGAPPVATLFPHRLAAAQAVVSLTGGVLLTGGFRPAGAALLATGALLHLGILLSTLFRIHLARTRQQVLPGMELR